jgi:hypothetical protein
LLTESLARVRGWLGGLIVAVWGVEALRFCRARQLAALEGAGLNYIVLTFAIALALLTGSCLDCPALTSTTGRPQQFTQGRWAGCE